MNRKGLQVVVAIGTLFGVVVGCAAPAPAAPTAAPTKPAAAATTAPAAVATPAAAMTTAAAPTAAAASATTAAPAATGGTIKIGFISGLSGVYAGIAQDQIRGLQMALDEVNNQIGGKQVQVIQRDDKLNTQEAATQAQDLIQNGQVNLLIGCVSAATTLSINEIAKRAGALYLGICQTNQLNKMPDFSPYTFHIALSPYMNSVAAGTWAVKNLGQKWFFLMPDYAFGHENYDGLSKVLKDNGGTELGVLWAPVGTSDWSTYIPKARDAKPDVLVAGMAGTDQVAFYKQATSFGLSKDMKIYSPVTDLAVEAPLGFDNLAGTYTAANFYWELADTVPTAKKFVDAYQAKYQGPPSGYSLYGYTAMRLLIDAVTKTGSTDPTKIAPALEGYKYDYARGSEFVRKCDHQVFQPVFVLKGRTAQEAQAANKGQWGFRQIVNTVPAAESNERSCQELGLGDRQ